MGDPVVPERPGGSSATAQEHAGIPAMPVILPREQAPGAPYPCSTGSARHSGGNSGRQPRAVPPLWSYAVPALARSKWWTASR
jgi:hypothetical protein